MRYPNNIALALLTASASCLLSGCSLHRPLMVKDQARLIAAKDQRLIGLAEIVQSKIQVAGVAGALVILPSNATTAPLILPASGPLEAASTHQTDLTSAKSCFFVSKRSTPVAPEPINCLSLAYNAKQIEVTAAKIKQSELDIRQAQLAIQDTRKYLGSMSAVAAEHDKQLKSMETRLNSLTQSNVGQNVRGPKIALASLKGDFLQCTCSVGGDGTMHANNRKVNQEEAWYLWTVGDPANHQVALANYRNGYFLWRHPGGESNHRVRNIHDIDVASTWTMVAGEDYGLPAGYVAFRAYDGAYLKARDGGGGANAEGEDGEVYVDNGAPTGDIRWAGWWRAGELNFDPQPGTPDVVQGVIDIGDGIYAGIKWFVENVVVRAFAGNPGAQNQPAPVPAPIACSALPPPVDTGTTRFLHAFCEGIIPTDLHTPFYSQNEYYAARRVECDIEEHHKTQPRHLVIPQVCDSGMTPVAGCEDVPQVPK